MEKLRVGVLASGRGSNLQAIIDGCRQGLVPARVVVVLSDKAGAYALDRARAAGIPAFHVNPQDFANKHDYERELVKILQSYGVQLVCLAGYLRLVGEPLLQAFPNRMMNIHPALLPAFPGLHGQRDALAYGVKIAGCTVHFVDEGIDTGPIILQAAVPVYDDDTEDTLAARILRQEHRLYPEAVKLFAQGRLRVQGRKVFIDQERDHVED
ncbi:phosphoribosylglycinamide formyltransferase [Desulforamulus hydrothermalis]|uniref:Phosphoribosylglycinamide formyltransferase n=1 Tax=Desulforamulus hydrothermalis Lam5 = DSM 18033 TaxID=1121428 RepID=K8E0X2_9FIRM|nr:phosphoribosylglycinamide formyltransferase [Desulforamulus hydrothermalis]CCO09230.1 Formyltetrahydrofolate-dependent phosphoribosylglycinamide formyltransferase [Desulforamulus hydrothermalis Lam5 = DSM 18033]SHH06036.1 formyltetrahydrofolate-dependent phosphoribosylglycinamide formyltransferase [Desulforamulus hydrothermalis Lam5 = DSM 18033]